MAIRSDVGIDVEPYADFGAFFGPAWSAYTDLQKRSNAYNPEVAARDLQSYGDQFKSQFSQLVGRAPLDGEISNFYKTVVAPQGSFPGGGYAGPQELSDRTQDFIGKNYQREAEAQAESELVAQQGEANKLADLFRTQGKAAIGGYENSLMDFAQKLFERVRPNLMTSLQAQGLLNTGGLNQALAGEQGDIARDAGQQVADLTLQNENAANAISYGGAAAPYEFAKGNILNRIPNLMASGQGALQRGFANRQQEMSYLNQLSLQNNSQRFQSGMQPSFLRTLGQNLAASAGQAGGQWLAPGGGSSDSGGGSTMAMAAMLSSKHFKKNITQLSEKEEDALYDRMIAMPLSRWHYKTEPDAQSRHLGVITQEAVPEIVMADGEHLSVVDYFGAITLALKVQHRRFSKGVK